MSTYTINPGIIITAEQVEDLHTKLAAHGYRVNLYWRGTDHEELVITHEGKDVVIADRTDFTWMVYPAAFAYQ